MKELYNKIDQYLLTRYPRLWVLGVHIFIPIVVISWCVLIAIGGFMVQGQAFDLYSVDDAYGQIAVGMILPVILLLILFIIRQAKYNANRVHQFLPYKHRFGVFLSFWVILFLISSLPMAVFFGSWFTPGLNLNRSAYNQDFDVIETNYPHFKLKGCFGSDKPSEMLYDNNENMGTSMYPCDYGLNETKDSVHLYRYQWSQYNYYYENNSTISVNQALSEIEEFMKVAVKYGAVFNSSNPQEIFDVNLSGNTIRFMNSNGNLTYNHIANFQEFETAINVNESYRSKGAVFVMFNWEFWRYYSLLSFSFAFLLIIFCSVERAEFGWSMLVCALMPTAYGIILGLLALIDVLDGEGGAKALLVLFVIGAAFMAFGNFKPRFKRIFGISLNIFLPIVLPIIFMDSLFHEDTYVVLCFLLGLILTFVFSFYYRLQYLHPRKT